MTDTLPEQRKGHPYVMYEMMKDIPNGLERTLKSMEKVNLDFLGDNITFTGNGTAYHSAVAGAQILYKYGRKWSAVQAYDLLLYRKISSLVIGISHTGKTKSTVDICARIRPELRDSQGRGPEDKGGNACAR